MAERTTFLLGAVILNLLCLSASAPPSDNLDRSPPTDPMSDEFIDYINSLNTSWVAGRNFHKDTPLSYIKHLCGLRRSHRHLRRLPVKKHDWMDIEIPKEFDARTKWPHCPSISEIRDQGHCGSCWAFAAVTAITDRICIHSNGAEHFHVSAENLLACADEDGCFGGTITSGWDYYKKHGLVSGGPYKSHKGCQPYSIKTCKYHAPCEDFYPTPACKRTCEAGYNKTFEEDLHFGASSYVKVGEREFQEELLRNGPIEVGFDVYHDFIHYTGGVYRHKIGKHMGGHAVRIIGWGVEKGDPYWLVANSWNTVWGVNGYFKILRGSNECGIEELASAGIPKPYHSR